MATLVTIDSDVGSQAQVRLTGGRQLVENGATSYLFYVDTNSDLVYKKSPDSGATWGNKVVIHAATYEEVSVWFDQWTPADAGTTVHIWGIEAGLDDVNYFSLNIATDTLGNSGTAIVVFAGASTSTVGIYQWLSGTKARGGNLYIAFDIDGGTERGFYRSVDAGANWVSRTSPFEVGANDFMLLFPGNETDTQDVWNVFWDRSTDELSLKVNADAADTWAETAIASSFTDISPATSSTQFAGSINPSNNHLYLAAWNNQDVSTADLQTWDINGGGSITARANIVTNADDTACVALAITPLGKVCAFYHGKESGADTAMTSMSLCRKTSTDGMVTWSAESALLETLFDSSGILAVALVSEAEDPFIATALTTSVGGGAPDQWVGSFGAPASGGKGSGGKGKGGQTPGPGENPKKPLRTSLSKSWKWDRGWR